MKVYLGGTANGSTWRNYVTNNLKIGFYDPTAIDLGDQAHDKNLYERRHCDFLLHVLTPKLTDFYSIAEVADDALKRPDRTIFCYLKEDGQNEFSTGDLESLENMGWRIEKNGALWLKSLEEVVNHLNSAKAQVEGFELEQEGELDAFICYGRKSSRGLVATLKKELDAKGHKSWYDDGLVPLEIGNLDKVNKLIEASHNFIFVISSHSARSEYSIRELEYAMKLKKRIIPVVHQQPEDYWENIPLEIRNGKMLYYISSAKINDLILEIVDIMEHEKRYVSKHTEILASAIRWHLGGRTQDMLLYGVPRKDAVKWYKTNFQNTAPPVEPAVIQKEFIYASEALSLSKQVTFFLDKVTSFLTKRPWFDNFIGIVSLANPISLIPQLISVLNHMESLDSISEYTFGLFAVLNLCFALVGAKQRNLGMFLSMFLSMLINVVIVSIKLIYGT